MRMVHIPVKTPSSASLIKKDELGNEFWLRSLFNGSTKKAEEMTRNVRQIISRVWHFLKPIRWRKISFSVTLFLSISSPCFSVLGADGTAGVSQPNFALQFDGSDDFARVLNVGNFDFTTTFTIEAWVKAASVASDGTWKALLSGRIDDQPSAGGGWMMYMPNADHSLWGMSVCSTPGGCASVLVPASSLTVNEWHHVAATYDGVNIQIFHDGNLANTKAQSGDVSEVNYLFIGAFLGTFNGLIDEVRIWNVARTPEAILSTVFDTLQGDEPGLVAYWPFDDGAGQFAADASGNGQAVRLGSTDGVDDQDPAWVASDSPIIPPFFQLTPLVAGLDTEIGISSIIASVFNCGWSPGETLEVWWDEPEIQLATFTVDAMGCFEGQFPLADERIGSSKTGTHEIQARGSVTGVVTSPFDLRVPQLHLNPSRGAAEIQISISGCGWDGAATVNVLWQKNMVALLTQ